MMYLQLNHVVRLKVLCVELIPNLREVPSEVGSLVFNV